MGCRTFPVNHPPFVCYTIFIIMTSNRMWTAILATIFVFVLTILSGESIHCWGCDSSEDPRCGDPFDNHTIAYVDCDQTSRAAGKNATFCRKYVQSVQGKNKITRSCGWLNNGRRRWRNVLPTIGIIGHLYDPLRVLFSRLQQCYVLVTHRCRHGSSHRRRSQLYGVASNKLPLIVTPLHFHPHRS